MWCVSAWRCRTRWRRARWPITRSKNRNWIVPLLGQHGLDRLTPEHLDAAYTIMLRRGLSPSTVLKVHRVLSRSLRIAVRRGRVTRNVATLVDAPVAASQEIEPLTREEAAAS